MVRLFIENIDSLAEAEEAAADVPLVAVPRPPVVIMESGVVGVVIVVATG